jgi:hypothetical protein
MDSTSRCVSFGLRGLTRETLLKPLDSIEIRRIRSRGESNIIVSRTQQLDRSLKSSFHLRSLEERLATHGLDAREDVAPRLQAEGQ